MDFGIVVTIIIAIVAILVSMTFHEAMHAFTGYWLGDDTAKLQGRLTLNPLKHIDPFLTVLLPIGLLLVGLPPFGGAKPVPFNPDRVRGGDWGAALVAVAGPLTNLVLAFVFFGIAVILTPVSAFASQALVLASTINLGFFIFNILPIPPLDGSRVLYAIAPELIRSGMRVIERYGILVVFVIVLVASPILGTVMVSSIDFFLQIFQTIFRA